MEDRMAIITQKVQMGKRQKRQDILKKGVTLEPFKGFNY